MANLYDTPAQAKFINTYVPIQFEGLYRASDNAKKNIQEGEALMDKLAEYSSLGSMSDVDNKTWENEVYGRARSIVDKNVTDSTSLSNPKTISKIRSAVREIASNPLTKNLLANKTRYEDVMSKADPRWGDYYSGSIKNFSTKDSGSFSAKPMDYSGWADRANSMLKGVGKTKIGREGFDDIFGVAEQDVRRIIGNNLEQVYADPSAKQLAQYELSRNPAVAEQYTVVDAQGNKSVDIGKYMYDALYAGAEPILTGKEYRTNTGRLTAYKEHNDLLVANAKAGAANAAAAASRVSSVWKNEAKEEVTERKMNRAFSAIEKAIGAAPADKKDEVGRRIAGSSIYNYYKTQNDINQLNSQIKQKEAGISNAAASNNSGALNTLKAEKAALDRKISEKRQTLQLHMPGAINDINVQTQTALSSQPGVAKSSIYTKKEILEMEQYEVPSMLSETWSDIAVGNKAKILLSNNTSINGYTADNTQTMRVSGNKYMQSGSGQFSFSNGGPNKSGASSVEKVNAALSSGKLAGDIIWTPSNKASLEADDRTTILGQGYISAGKLKSIGLTDSEISALKAIGGKVTGRPIIEKLSINDYENNMAEPIEYIKIPISTDFIGEEGSVPNMILDREVDKKSKLPYTYETQE